MSNSTVGIVSSVECWGAGHCQKSDPSQLIWYLNQVPNVILKTFIQVDKVSAVGAIVNINNTSNNDDTVHREATVVTVVPIQDVIGIQIQTSIIIDEDEIIDVEIDIEIEIEIKVSISIITGTE